MLFILAKIKSFFKKYWGILVGVFALVAYLLWKKKPEPDNTAAQIRQSGKDLSRDIDNIREGEKAAVDAEIQLHQQNSEEIKSKYEEKKDQLEDDVKAEAEQLFIEHKDDPEKLAEELSRVTGFRIILPKD